MFDADDAGGETDADRVGEGDVGREGQRDFELGPWFDGAVEVEENAAGADVLGLGVNLAGAFKRTMAGRRMSKRRIIRRSCEFGCMPERPIKSAYFRKATADGNFPKCSGPVFPVASALQPFNV